MATTDGGAAVGDGGADDGGTVVGDDGGIAPSDAGGAVDGGGVLPPPDAGPLGAECGASTLGDLADSMDVRTFARLDGTGWSAELIDATAGHNVIQYMTKAVWDARTCQAMLYGGGHLSEMKFLSFVAATNTWTRLPNPDWWCYELGSYGCSTHGYEHNAFISDEGTFLFRVFNSDVIRTYQVTDVPTSTWGTLPQLPDEPARCIATGIEYFPDRREIVYVDCTTQSLAIYHLDAGTWSSAGSSLAMGPYHNVASYNPVHHVVAFGGGNGSGDLHVYDTTGAIRTIRTAPFWVGTGYTADDDRHILTVDPRGGRYLAYASEQGLWEYDVPTDAWGRVDVEIPDNLQVAIPVPSYGVVLFLGRGPEEVWVYKHAG
jgi:hypothetical protein